MIEGSTVKQINLGHHSLETLRAAIVKAWHAENKPAIAMQYAALLDDIERQAGMRRTRLDEAAAQYGK